MDGALRFELRLESFRTPDSKSGALPLCDTPITKILVRIARLMWGEHFLNYPREQIEIFRDGPDRNVRTQHM